MAAADPDRFLVAEIHGEARHHAKWPELTADEEAAAVADLRELANGRADLLATVAGLLKGFSEGELDEPPKRQAAHLRRMVGAGRPRVDAVTAAVVAMSWSAPWRRRTGACPAAATGPRAGRPARRSATRRAAVICRASGSPPHIPASRLATSGSLVIRSSSWPAARSAASSRVRLASSFRTMTSTSLAPSPARVNAG